MAEEIGSLEIQIQAQATKANNAIDKLITKLDRLSTSLGSINSSSLVGLANGVNRLANSMQGMNNVKTADFTRIATGVQKLANIDTASINRAASAMTQIGKAVNGISVSTGASTQIAELAKGIAQLGYKSSTQAIENIPKLATAMQGLMTTLSKAPTVSQNLINMTNALAKLARTGSSSGKAATSLANSLNVFSKSASRAKTSSFSLAAAFGKLYASYWLLFRAFGKVKEMINLSSALTEVQNVVDVTFGNMTSKVEEFSKTSIQQLGMSELAFKQYASRFQAMGSAMSINPSLIENANSFLSKQTDGYIGLSDSMSDVSINLTKLAADMASFYNVEQSAVAEDLESIFTGMTRPLRAYGLDLTEATLKEWALKNGLDADIDSMSQAQKTMLRYQYVLANTGAAQGDFARTSDTWANQVRILTENFKALGTIIGSWFVNALKPFVRALNQTMQYVIAFAETVTNALGSIFGWKFEVSGGGVADDWSDSMEDYSDSLGDAAGNAKKLKTQLLGIDELNVLSEDSSDSGSGSGSGGVSGVDGTQGQIVPAETIFKEYESSIKTLEQLGNKIRDSLIGAMDSIQWENVFEKARNFGTGLADFLNGLLDYDGEGRTLFGKVAQTLANTLNTIVYAAQSFAEEFDFYQLGVNIADALNNFFDTFDFKAAANTLNKWVDGLKETIKGFLDTADWSTVWNGVKDFLGELELDTVAVIIGGFTLKYLGKTLTGFMLKNALTNKFSDIAKAAGLSTGTAVLGTALCAIEVALVLSQFTKDFNDWKTNIETYGWDEGRKKTAEENQANPYIDDSKYNQKLDEMRQRWDNLRTHWATNNKANPYVEDSEYNKKLDEVRQNWDSVRRNWAENNHANPYIETSEYNQNIENIKSSWENLKINLSQKWDGMKDWFSENVSIWFTEEQWSTLWENVKTAFSTKWGEIQAWWQESALYLWWEEDVKPWFEIDDWSVLWDNVKEAFSTKWEEIKTWWNESAIGKWWKEDVEPWFTKKKWEDTMKGVKEAFSTTWEGAISSIKEIWNKFATWLNEKLTWTIDPVVVLGKTVFPGTTINLGKIPTFEVGGFPEDGLFMANHNELVGQFSNGRTAVANNEMITAGIEEAAYRGFARAYAENSREADLLVELIEAVREGKTIAIDGRELVSAIDERNKRNGFSFA